MVCCEDTVMGLTKSREYRTVVKCSGALETALKSDRDIMHFLNSEGFITDEVWDDVLDARSMLTPAQKAGKLVKGIRNKVSESPQHYHTLVEHLSKNRIRYGSIVDKLNREYATPEQPGMTVTTLS